MRKNIIMITDYAAPYEGNFIASMKEFEKIAKDKNYQVKFLFSERTADIQWIKKMALEYKIEFFAEDMTSIMNILSKSISRNSENIVYSHFAKHKTQLAIKLFRMLHSNVKLVQHFHNHCKVNYPFPKKQFMKFAYKLYEGDLNIGCSKSVAESMPYPKRKVTFVDNAIDFRRLDGNAVGNMVKKADDKFVILMFGFNYERKGVDIALKAIRQIADEKKIVLAISLATNKEIVENKIKSQFEGEIPDWIRILPPSENVSEYYYMADLFLSAAREEGFCYSLVEATYCGTRCMSSRIGGVPLDIPGMISFENENVGDLKNKILGTIENDENKLEEAKKYVVEKYDLSKWAKEIMKKLEA